MRVYRARATVAVLSAAMITLPAAAAVADTGSASPSAQRSAHRSAAPSERGNPASERARAAAVCDDAKQVGSTGYVKRNGTTIASVKQFYSKRCKVNYGYLWVWDSFRDSSGPYDVGIGVYSYPQDKVLGLRTWKDTRVQEFWSDGTATVAECTAALGTVRKVGEPSANQGMSAKRC